jgi:hypothetical protein
MEVSIMEGVTLKELSELSHPYTFELYPITSYRIPMVAIVLRDDYGHKCGGYFHRDDLEDILEVRRLIKGIKRRLDEFKLLKGE